MINREKFEESYGRLNAEQRQAVDAIEGPVMVIAGPGTGKTEVLTMRIANIVDKTDTPPTAILALTFTESGVASMRRRLADLIGAPAYQVGIATFHGFANAVIRDYPDKFPEIIGSMSITDVDQVRILRDILDNEAIKETLKPFGDTYYYLKSILRAVGELKQQGVTPKEFKDIVAKERANFESIEDLYYESGAHKGKMKGKYQDVLKHIDRNHEMAGIYAKYQAALRELKHYDYSDMITYVMLALDADEDLRLTLQERYLYFLVDEHQDTNDAQNRIVERLAGFHENPNLFVVGDEKQAIFRFQGASLANFYHFKNVYKNVTLITLRNNYRSTQTILDAAHTVAPRDVALISKAGHAEEPVALATFSAPEVEYLFIARKAKELIAQGVPPEEITVLYRENRDAGPLADTLEKQGVPFTIESDQDALGDTDIQKLVHVLKAIQRFGHAPELLDVLHADFLEIPALDVYKLFAYCGRNRQVGVYDVMRSPALLAQAQIEAVQKFTDLYDKLSMWKRDAENLGAIPAFENIVRGSGFLAAMLNRPNATEKIAKLHALFEHLKSLVEQKKNYTLRDFFAYLDLIQEQNVAIKSADTSRRPGCIRLMTAHKSKGQEFAYVFIMNAIDGKWGGNKRTEHIRLPQGIYRTLESVESVLDEDGDERNLFYVALTRAKKQAYITYSKTRRDGREQLPTKFIQEMKEGILAPLNVSSYEAEFAEHRELAFAPRLVTAPGIKDRAFLNELFAGQGLSPTALNNYLDCPWHYFYVNLIRIPEAPNKNLMYGNAMHGALQSYFDLLAEEEDRGLEYMLNRFEQELDHQPIEAKDFDETLAKGKRALTRYFDAYHATWIHRVLNEKKVAGIELEPGVTINGKIDKIEFIDNGETVNVVDYKTGKPKSRNVIEGNTKTADGNYKRQLVFYRLLLDKEGKHKMVSGEIDFVEADDKGKLHKERFEIRPEEVVELEQKIIASAHEIQNLAFWDTFCDAQDCRYCELRRALK